MDLPNLKPSTNKPSGLKLFFAKQYAKFIPPTKIVGVTGSLGKTTTIAAIRAILSQKMSVVTTNDDGESEDNYFQNTQTILKTRGKTDKVILEYSPKVIGEMDPFVDFLVPQTIVLTKLLSEQLYFSNPENLIKEYSKLIEKTTKESVTIVNWEDPLSRRLTELIPGVIIYYGFNSHNCHIWAGNIKVTDVSTHFELNYGVERIEVTTRLLGYHQILSLLAAAALAISIDIPLTSVKKGLELLEPLEHRLQPLEGANNSIVLDDTYSDMPYSYIEALETLNHIPARRRIVVLGEMEDLGDQSEKYHREVARKIYKDKVDLVLIREGKTDYIADELKKLGFFEDRIKSEQNNTQIITLLLKTMSRGDVVLVKGNQLLQFNEILKRITQKKR